jgi:hypothetical protein
MESILGSGIAGLATNASTKKREALDATRGKGGLDAKRRKRRLPWKEMPQ